MMADFHHGRGKGGSEEGVEAIVTVASDSDYVRAAKKGCGEVREREGERAQWPRGWGHKYTFSMMGDHLIDARNNKGPGGTGLEKAV